MKTINKHANRAGSALVTSVVLLAVAGFALGAIITVTTSYSRQGEMAMYREKAMFLSDAGLNAAVADLNNSGDGIISYTKSQTYFADQSAFEQALEWGFKTEVRIVDGEEVLVSTGKYRGSQKQVQTGIRLGSGSRSVHALYAHALYAGNYNGSNSVLKVGGTGSGADFVRGDVYSGGDIQLSGSAFLRLPEWLDEVVYDGIWNPTNEAWADAYTSQIFTNPLTVAQFNAYESSMAPYMDLVYNNGCYDYGEAFVDDEGNGIYDEGEVFTDTNGNGVRDAGDGYIDHNGNEIYDEGIDTIVDNGNGVWDEGEEWTDDPGRRKRQNGRYDPAGGWWKYKRGSWSWKTKTSTRNWPPEDFEDSGDSNFDPGEPWEDGNGIYDEGERYVDDRNGRYDYGTQAYGVICGMPSPASGQVSSTGGDSLISPPDLAHMYYDVSKDNYEPIGALGRWGHDVAVTASDYGSEMAITDSSRPEHIFVRNADSSGYSGGVYIQQRSFTKLYDEDGERIDDYFFEDPTDPTYRNRDNSASIDGTQYTSPEFINVKSEHNVKVYYVEGNVYIHSPTAYCMRFREPGTRITIVAKGNITISDEFYYNADYDPDLERDDVDSTIVNNPSDALALIALKNPNCSDSGNIYIGDKQFGTGGAIHAMLYAENDFVDNNLNTANQPFISVFGNMTAGNKVELGRSGNNRTRLDVTLDERVRDGEIIVPGLPHSVGSQRSIQLDTAWYRVPGTWESWSQMEGLAHE